VAVVKIFVFEASEYCLPGLSEQTSSPVPRFLTTSPARLLPFWTLFCIAEQAAVRLTVASPGEGPSAGLRTGVRAGRSGFGRGSGVAAMADPAVARRTATAVPRMIFGRIGDIRR
jgi:hypothetical protein